MRAGWGKEKSLTTQAQTGEGERAGWSSHRFRKILFFNCAVLPAFTDSETLSACAISDGTEGTAEAQRDTTLCRSETR